MTSDEVPESIPAAAESAGKYKLPSEINQLIAVFGAQMRLYSKSKVAILFIALAIMIPVLAYSGVAETIIRFFTMAPPSTSYLLALLPLMIVVIPAMMAGRILSSEFRNRTAYLLFTLPVSRATYYTGKFLAAFVLSTGVFALAYAFAVICGAGLYGPSYPNNVMGSFIVCISGVFALTAMSYGLSTCFKKGSTGLVIALMLFLPIILAMIIAVYDLDWGILKTLPPFTGYQSMNLLDTGMGGMLFGSLFQVLASSYSAVAYAGMSAAWGAAFFVLGMINVNKKEL
jgi:ABC-type transport system involved in multi-copper enzyme maturation permease subunit